MRLLSILMLSAVTLPAQVLSPVDGSTLYHEDWQAGSAPCGPNPSSVNPAYANYLNATGCRNQPYSNITLGTGGAVGLVAAGGKNVYPWSSRALQITVGTAGNTYVNFAHPVLRGTRWTWTLRFRPTTLVAVANYSHSIWQAGAYAASPTSGTRTCAIEAHSPSGVTTYVQLRGVGVTTSADTAAQIAVNTDHTVVITCDPSDTAGSTNSTISVDGGPAQTFQSRAFQPYMSTFGYLFNTVKANVYQWNTWQMTDTSNLPGPGNGPAAVIDLSTCTPGTTLTNTQMAAALVGGTGSWGTFTSTGTTCSNSSPQTSVDGFSALGKYYPANGWGINQQVNVTSAAANIGTYTLQSPLGPYTGAASWIIDNRVTSNTSDSFWNEIEAGSDYLLGAHYIRYANPNESSLFFETGSGNELGGLPALSNVSGTAGVYGISYTPGSKYFQAHTHTQYVETGASSAATGLPFVVPGAVDPSGSACTSADTVWTQTTSGAVGNIVVFPEGSITPSGARQSLLISLVSGLPTQTDYWVGSSSGCKYYPGVFITGTMTSGSMFANGTAVTLFNGASSVATGVAMGIWGNAYGIMIIGPTTGTWVGTSGFTIKDGSGAVFTVNSTATFCGFSGLKTWYPHTFDIMRLHDSSCQLLQTFINDGCGKAPIGPMTIWLPGVGFDTKQAGSNYNNYTWGHRLQAAPNPLWTIPCK